MNRESEHIRAEGGADIATDYAALMEEAQALHHDRFVDRAEREAATDPELAKDLLLTVRIAEDLRERDAVTRVVGGYARDLAIARETGQPMRSKDIDAEIYGIEFADLVEFLQPYGRVDVTGESFVVAKLTRESDEDKRHVIDFSIPREDSKVDRGHKGFVVTGNPKMTIREAARRRDLTINALALDPLSGQLTDEYGGLQDIHDRVLRATDYDLFPDDPLRVLRVAQFAGRFDYTVEPRTAELCRGIDLTELPKERIGEEWLKLMTLSPRPSAGLEVARELGILAKLHPELEVLDQIEQEPDWHPEGNVWIHSKLAADAAAHVVRAEGIDPESEDGLVVLFGALCHDLGKATTTGPREKHGVMRITAHGHAEAGVDLARSFLGGIHMKRGVIDKVLPIVAQHMRHINIDDPTQEQVRNLAKDLSPANVRLWNLVSRCDSNGRGSEFTPDTPSNVWYRRSLELKVSEKPAPHLVQGRELLELGFTPGQVFKYIVDELYDAQLDGTFITTEDGVEYFRANEEAIVRRATEAAETAAREEAERREVTRIATRAAARAANAAAKAAARAKLLDDQGA